MATVVEAFEYGQKAGRQMAFLQRAGAVEDATLRVVVVIGGLTDGPFSLAYSPLLATSLASIGFSLVHFVLRSSYIGYGIHTLEHDAEDLAALLDSLVRLFSVHEVVLLGHSTGTQDIVHFVARSAACTEQHRSLLRGVVLQAPVSDRDYAVHVAPEDVARYRSLALELAAATSPEALMPRDACPFGLANPITASRYLSLTGRLTLDDMWSNDLQPDELRHLFVGITSPVLMAISLDDEYVPSHIDKRLLAQRLFDAMPANVHSSLDFFAGNHALDGVVALEFTNRVARWIQSLPNTR